MVAPAHGPTEPLVGGGRLEKLRLIRKTLQLFSASSERLISPQHNSSLPETEDPDDPGPTQPMHRAQTSTRRGLSEDTMHSTAIILML